MYTGDVLLLGEDIRLKFNDPQEASFLRKKRRSEHRSMVILHCDFANIIIMGFEKADSLYPTGKFSSAASAY